MHVKQSKKFLFFIYIFMNFFSLWTKKKTEQVEKLQKNTFF